MIAIIYLETSEECAGRGVHRRNHSLKDSGTKTMLMTGGGLHRGYPVSKFSHSKISFQDTLVDWGRGVGGGAEKINSLNFFPCNYLLLLTGGGAAEIPALYIYLTFFGRDHIKVGGGRKYKYLAESPLNHFRSQSTSSSWQNHPKVWVRVPRVT